MLLAPRIGADIGLQKERKMKIKNISNLTRATGILEGLLFGTKNEATFNALERVIGILEIIIEDEEPKTAKEDEK